MKCEHENFAAFVSVGRLTDEDGNVTSYTAEVRVQCNECKRPMQFLGLEPGVDLRGARVSVDGLQANLAICPQGEQLSPLDNIIVNIGAKPGVRH